MTEIDWSKAPAGANQYQPAATPNNRPVFWRVEGSVAREVWAMNPDGSVRDHFKYGTDGCQAYSPWRCIIKPIAWNGEGLPPIGAKCEVENEVEGGFDSVDEVLVHTIINGSEVAVFKRQERIFMSPAGKFRPVRTKEQIAAEEREKAIAEMWSTYWQPQVSTAMEGLGLLYDAGYRKRVAP